MFEKISKLSVKLSGKCNFCCVYCHQDMFSKTHKNEFNDFDNLYKFILSLPLDDIIDVTVTGGEITTFPELFEKCVKEIKKIEKIKDIRFDICVVHNGSNVDKIIEWCNKKTIVPYKTSISWDGLCSCSKSRLSNSYTDEYILNELKKIGNSRYNEQISIVYAITPITLPYMYDSFKWLIDNGLTNFGYYFIHEANYQGIEKEFENQIDKISQLLVEELSKVNDIRFYNWELLLSRRLYPENFYLCNKLGMNYHIDIDGKIYPCIYFGDHKAIEIGDIKSGIDIEKRDNFVKNYLRHPTCDYKYCKCFQCTECPASCFVHNHSLQKRFENQCVLLKIENRVYDKYLSELKEYQKKKFIISDDVCVKNEYKILDDCLSCSINNFGVVSPNYNRVQKWGK